MADVRLPTPTDRLLETGRVPSPELPLSYSGEFLRQPSHSEVSARGGMQRRFRFYQERSPALAPGL